MLTLYTAWMVPYSVAFQYRGANDEQGPNEVLFWLIIDSFVDVIFIADIGTVIAQSEKIKLTSVSNCRTVVNFMTSLISESGELLKDAKIIQMNYVSNWYCLDLLSCLPYDIIYFILDGLKPDDESENDSNASATSLFSALKGK